MLIKSKSKFLLMYLVFQLFFLLLVLHFIPKLMIHFELFMFEKFLDYYLLLLEQLFLLQLFSKYPLFHFVYLPFLLKLLTI